MQMLVWFWFLDFNGFWRENAVTGLTAKIAFELMPKKKSDFERTCRNRIICEKTFLKGRLVKKLLSFDF